MIEEAVDKIKIGFFEQENGKFTAFMRIQHLPDQPSAIKAAEWMADIMTSATAEPEEIN